MPPDLDLNLLKVLDALAAEGSVTGAAQRLHLSIPATSRALGRLRRAFGDPVFVRAGRGLAPTPFTHRVAPQVRSLLDAVDGVLTSERELDPAALDRRFAIRINDGVASTLALHLVRRVIAEAPRVTLRFVGEGAEDVEALRDGTVDIDVGVHDAAPAADLREAPLYVDTLAVVVDAGSDLGRTADPSPAQVCAHPHVVASRRGIPRGPFDEALAAQGLARHVAAVVGSFTVAALMVAGSDLVGLVPRRMAEQHGATLGLRALALPIDLPRVPIAARWHSRLDADPAQRWLRAHLRAAAAQAPAGTRGTASINARV
jgi:DNA-binding transcriptional LysR family regulator